MKKLFNKDVVVVLLSIVAIIVSIWTCSRQNQSNELAEKANTIAQDANTIAQDAYAFTQETSDSSLKFSIINAEVQWGILRDSYNEIDYKILTWENSRNLKRDGKPAVSMKSLETQLEKLCPPDEIRRLYNIRHEKYLALQNVSEQYKPFEERLAHIDFSLPSAPVLPSVTMRGVSGSGFSIR